MRWGGGEKQKKRPERLTARIELSCGEEEVLTRENFRIFAYLPGADDPVGKALILSGEKDPVPEFILGNLTVNPEYQGRGIGSQMMDRFEAIILRHKGKGIVGDAIDKNSAAAGMYEKRGWRKEKTKDGERLVFP